MNLSAIIMIIVIFKINDWKLFVVQMKDTGIISCKEN
jgi:hypothetical protein